MGSVPVEAGEARKLPSKLKSSSLKVVLAFS